jgi:hypothetical protein
MFTSPKIAAKYARSPVTNTWMGKLVIIISDCSSSPFFILQVKFPSCSLINCSAPNLMTSSIDSFNNPATLDLRISYVPFIQLMCPTFITILPTCFPSPSRRMILITDLNFPCPWLPLRPTSILFKMPSAASSAAMLFSRILYVDTYTSSSLAIGFVQK